MASEQQAERGEPGGSALREIAEDATGFGVAELRLTSDLILRPRRVIDAYDELGSTAGGLYPKPFRYYLTLNGLYLLLIALMGGFEQVFSATMRPEDVAIAARAAGKSPDEFMADLDQWSSLLMVPVTTLVFVPPIFLLIRRWSPAGDRQDLRQTFIYLSAWTLYGIPLGLVPLVAMDLMYWTTAAGVLLWVVPYAVMGKGRWWRTRRGAVIKGVVLMVVAVLAMIPASLLVGAAAMTGAMLAP